MFLEDAFDLELLKINDRRAVLHNLYEGLLHNLTVLEANLSCEKTFKAVTRGTEFPSNGRDCDSKKPQMLPNVQEVVQSAILAALRYLALRTYFDYPRRSRPRNEEAWSLLQAEVKKAPDAPPSKIVAACKAKWVEEYKKNHPNESLEGALRKFPLTEAHMKRFFKKNIKL